MRRRTTAATGRGLATAGSVNGQIHVTTEPEWRALVDRAARYYLDMDVDTFVRAWEHGEIDHPDRPEVLRVAMLLPVG